VLVAQVHAQGFKKYYFQQNLFKVLRDTINMKDNIVKWTDRMTNGKFDVHFLM
jgi:hypothetical protein